jgi:hypothetical protein
MSISGNDMISVFGYLCKDKKKLFVPDSPRQDDVAKSLVEHYDGDDLLDAIKLYISSEQGPILIFDFALKSRDLVEKVKKERTSVEKFKQTVADTRKLIQEDEL